MKNSVFIYPRDLELVHDQMTGESNARHDELYIKKKNKEFPEIAKRYESLCKKYQAAAEGTLSDRQRTQGRSSWKEENCTIVSVVTIIFQNTTGERQQFCS